MSDDNLEDLGPPVTELRELKSEPKPGFVSGIRNRIDRRVFAGNMLDLSIPMIMQVVMQYLAMMFSLFDSEKKPASREDRDHE